MAQEQKKRKNKSRLKYADSKYIIVFLEQVFYRCILLIQSSDAVLISTLFFSKPPSKLSSISYIFFKKTLKMLSRPIFLEFVRSADQAKTKQGSQNETFGPRSENRRHFRVSLALI